MANEQPPINGAPRTNHDSRQPLQFSDSDLRDCRPFANDIVGKVDGMRPTTAVAGAALALAMIARVANATPFQAWKLFDLWMRIIADDGKKPMGAPKSNLLTGRDVVDELEDRLRHIIVSCAHKFDLNTDEVRAAVMGLANAELERLTRAKAIAARPQ